MSEPLLLSHFSATPVGVIEERRNQAPGPKPAGLWLSVDGEDDWESWCRGEDYGVARLAIRHRVTLAAGANVLHLHTVDSIDEFTLAFGFRQYGGLDIDWRAVCAKHDGIIIAPYQWARRLHDGSRWYYGWDCASGCIWHPRAIASIEVVADSRREAA